MIEINGNDLGLTEIVFCFVVAFVVSKLLWETWQFIRNIIKSHTDKAVSDAFEEQRDDDAIAAMQESLKQIQETINHTNSTIIQVQQKLDTEMDALKINTRHSIIRACEEYINRGYIESYELKALEDLYSSYKDNLNGNSYTKDLMWRVRRLEIQRNIHVPPASTLIEEKRGDENKD